MLRIACKERWCHAMELSRAHNDKTFAECVMKLLRYYALKDVDEVCVYTGINEHCFDISVLREDVSVCMEGEMIFHGFSQKPNKKSGWSIRTTTK